MNNVLSERLILPNVTDRHLRLHLGVVKTEQKIKNLTLNYVHADPTRTNLRYLHNIRISMDAFTRTQLHQVTVARSSGGCKYWLKCDCGGIPRRLSEENRRRKCATMIYDCRFQLYSRIKKDGLCPLIVKNGEHYHPPTLDVADHAAARRLKTKQKLVVELNIKASESPRESLTSLKQEDPGTRMQGLYTTCGLVSGKRT